ncbi:MAG: PAS domain-containing protein [Bacteroidales bacterium]
MKTRKPRPVQAKKVVTGSSAGKSSSSRRAADEQEVPYRNILESLVEEAVFFSPQMEMLWANMAACKSKAGKYWKQSRGEKCPAALKNLNRPCDHCPVREAIDTGKMVTRGVTSSDGRCWLVSGIPVRDDNGKLLGGLEITREMDPGEGRDKEAEEARRTLELVINNIPQRIFWKDKNLKFRGSNRWFALDAGLSSSKDIVGKDDTQLGWKSNAEAYQSDDREVLRTGKPKMGYEEPQTTPDGDIIWLRTNKVPVTDEEGNITGILGTYENITREKKLIEELKLSEERWKFALEGSGDGVWDWNIPENEVFFSNRWKEMLGYRREEIPNDISSWEKLVHPDDVSQVQHELQRHLEGETPYYSIEYRILTKKGEYRWILDRGKVVEKDGEGKPLRMIGTHSDIHFLKETQLALEYREQQLKLAMRAAKYYTFFYAPQEHSLMFSDNFWEDLGYRQKASPEGSDIYSYLHPDDRGPFEKSLEAYREKNPSDYYFEFRFRASEGVYRWYGVSGRQMRSIDGEESFALQGLLTDITARKEAEQAILRMNEELEERVKARTAELREAYRELESFSYSVSHDLRAPLRHIDGFAEMLRERSYNQLDTTGKQYLLNICESVKRLGEMIENLLVFSRAGRSELHLIRFNLNLLFTEVINEFLPETRDRNIHWEIEPLGEVVADPSLLRQVVYNLISNAVKYTGKEEKAVISVGKKIIDGRTVYYVKDNGVGFRMKYAERIFGVFQRLHLDDEFEGTGIGLAHAKKIIQRHGGKIWAEGKEGEGAVFYFNLASG